MHAAAFLVILCFWLGILFLPQCNQGFKEKGSSVYNTEIRYGGRIVNSRNATVDKSTIHIKVFYVPRKKYEGKYPRQVPTAAFKGNYGTIRRAAGEEAKVAKDRERAGSLGKDDQDE